MGIIKPQPLRVKQRHATMITFYRDKDGTYIYYPDDNQRLGGDVYLNNSIEFHPGKRCTLVEPRALQRIKIKSVVTSYKHKTRDEIIPAYKHEKRKLELNAIPEEEITPEEEVELIRLDREWEPIKEDEELREDIPFQIIDIDYPADPRLTPLRHYAESANEVNHFEINGEEIAMAHAHKLCQDAGLKRRMTERHNKERGTYYLDDDFYWWNIEGENYGERDEMRKWSKSFTGTLEQCMKRIADIEAHVQSIFDSWAIALIEPSHMTVKYLEERLDSLRTSIQHIEPKIKTRKSHQAALQKIEEIIKWVKEKTKEKLDTLVD